LKAPGFNPRAYQVISWFQILLFQMGQLACRYVPGVMGKPVTTDKVKLPAAAGGGGGGGGEGGGGKKKSSRSAPAPAAVTGTPTGTPEVGLCKLRIQLCPIV
jgi:hypothetical protein